ncbi:MULTISPECIES: sulfite reductase subunit alpha [Pseudomonas]|nr:MULTISPECIES: sulfite reductase flavoprotein subunit alpha [Pseudomonas]
MSVRQQRPDLPVRQIQLPGDPQQPAQVSFANGQQALVTRSSGALLGAPQAGSNRRPLTPMTWALLLSLLYLIGCLGIAWRWRRRHPQSNAPSPLLISYASQSGQAERLAREAASYLQVHGQPARLLSLDQVDAQVLDDSRQALLVLSTYGDGEAPDNAARFARQLLGRNVALSHLDVGVLGLGDRHYPHFCRFAQQVEQWLRHNGAQPLFTPLWADQLDPATLQQWSQQLAKLAGDKQVPPTDAPLRPVHLAERQLLNPGSPGAPAYRIELQADALPSWQAGDVLELRPQVPTAQVAAGLQQLGLAPDTLVEGLALAEQLAHRQLPTDAGAWQALRGLDADALLAHLPPLPLRTYSLASLPASGRLELLVRLVTLADGQPGLGSGWLCQHAPLGAAMQVRLRANPAFHHPPTATPLILIGAGTGLAGLLAHLRTRQPGAADTWLLFGERSPEHDRWYSDALQQALQDGRLQHLDCAFTRAEPAQYVQDLLSLHSERLRAWLARGAALYVCGRLEGMGQGVEQRLIDLLGASTVDDLRTSGRYRRDLY